MRVAHSVAMETIAGIRPRLRAARAALFAALCVTLSSTSHVLLAREPLPLTAVAGAYAAVFALAFALGGQRERGFWPIAGLMVPLELAVDTLFTSGQQACYGPGPAAPSRAPCARSASTSCVRRRPLGASVPAVPANRRPRCCPTRAARGCCSPPT